MEEPDCQRNPAAANAGAGRFLEAIETAQRALQLAIGEANSSRAGSIRAQIQLYQSGAAFVIASTSRQRTNA